ncbi:MAG: hypothetical protein GPJ54_18650 [Candidatus Heimdallarchaeota archaeon]|nr:hypothetical protein [Candidatus Heimdallarchaeota archaeon]
MDGREDKSNNIFNSEAIKKANLMFFEDDNSFPVEAIQAFNSSITKGWFTRQYFSKGRHDLVLPAWLLGKIGPDGEGRHGIAGIPVLKNSDLRSYIALGSPDSEEEPVVDHRGGIIPVPDSYTMIFGTLLNDRPFYSSEIGKVKVELHEEGYPIVSVYWELEDGDTMVYDLFSDCDEDGNEMLIVSVVRGFSDHQLFVTICPMDQDGVTTISSMNYDTKELILTIDKLPKIKISKPPIRVVTSPIVKGHAGRQINQSTFASSKAECKAGLASWAAAFPVRESPTFIIELSGDNISNLQELDMDDVEEKWEDTMGNIPVISTSSENVDQLFKSSASVLRLLADVNKSIITVGPSQQEQIWMPALPFQIMALDRLGFSDPIARSILDNVYNSIDSTGLAINDKQWDGQGGLIMAFAQHFYFTNDINWLGDKFTGLKRITDWLARQRKRMEKEGEVNLTKGLLPKGNLAWFDPIYWKNDYSYSHNFWCAGGLNYLQNLAEHLGRHGESEKFKIELEKYKQDLDDSITAVFNNNYLPVGPTQRDTAGMIFNLYAFHPLSLYLAEFQPLAKTVHWLLDNYVHEGGLLIDQPWNAFGTYHAILLAQACRYLELNADVLSIINFLVENVTNAQGWAEGISPLSRKGSVGDSPSGFAAAEWVNLILDLFAQQHQDTSPHLLKGMPIQWLENGVSATGLNLLFNSKLDLTAKLNGSTLTIEWDYKTEREAMPHLFLPYPMVSSSSSLDQIASREVILPTKSGQLQFELEIQ